MERDKGDEYQPGTEERDSLNPEIHERPSHARRGWLLLAAALLVRALVNPRLALDLLGVVWAFRSRNWYRTPPFLPLPPREYLEWRMYTAYGDERAVPPAEDVARFAEWRRKLLRL